MTKKRLLQLLEFLPDSAPFLTRLPRPERMATPLFCQQRNIDRRSAAETDPAFGWHFMQSFIEGRIPFPNHVQEEAIMLSYECKTRGITPDPDLGWAWGTLSPDMVYQRDLCSALLLVPDISYREIGAQFDITEKAVRHFETLFFNVRDRIHEAGYIGNIISAAPDYLLDERNRNYFQAASRRIMMFRLARRGGADSVFEFVGISKSRHRHKDPDQLFGMVKQHIGSTALHTLELGGAYHNSPDLAFVRSIGSAQASSGTEARLTDSMAGLEAIGIEHSVLSHMAKMQVKDIDYRSEVLRKEMEKGGSKKNEFTPPVTSGL